MALIHATLPQLKEALLSLIAKAAQDRPTTAQLFQLMYNTGLRVREVLEVERWDQIDSEYFEVQLEKKEGKREISKASMPAPLIERYALAQPFEMETYSAVNNTFKYYGPGILFGNDTRRTTCHAFRYAFMKQLSANGMTTAEIASEMGHVNLNNTARYVSDEIWLGS